MALAALGLLGFGCESEQPAEPASPRILAAQLVAEDGDRLSFSGENAFLIEIYTTRGVDSVPSIRTEHPPVLQGDSVLTGLIVRNGATRGAFRYSIHSGEVQEISLPVAGFDSVASAAKLSPDGRYLAYVRHDTAELARLRVDSWPAGEPLMRGPLLQIDCVRMPRNRIRWSDDDTLDVLIDRCAPDGRWLRLHGSVAAKRLVSETHVMTDSRLLR